jgi:hypothetical protein
MNDDHPYYVYALVDPRDDIIFYIGEGKGYRPEQHLIEAALITNQSEKVNKIREVWKSDNDVKIIFLARDFQTQQEALEIESILLIEARNSQKVLGLSCNLTNIKKGDYEKCFRAWGQPGSVSGFDYRRRAIESAEMYEDSKPLYAYIIEKLPEFRHAISITDQHIRTQPNESGFEFVLKPKQGKFIYFEYIARSTSEDLMEHAKKIRSITGYKNVFTYPKVEREVIKLEITQLEQVAIELKKFIQDIYKAERKIKADLDD